MGHLKESEESEMASRYLAWILAGNLGVWRRRNQMSCFGHVKHEMLGRYPNGERS